MKQMPDKEEQCRRLSALASDCAGWGVLLLIQPPYDVSFLIPVVPALVGCEIVAATPDPDKFDIWKDDAILELGWNLAKVSAWLAANTPDDETLKLNIAEWVEDAMIRYNVPRKERS